MIDDAIQKKCFAWYEMKQYFDSHPKIRNVQVRVLSENIVADFLNFMGGARTPVADTGVNRSLSGNILRMYQRNPSLRPGEHASKIDFSLERRLSPAGGQTPWILNEQRMRTITSAYEAGNRALLACLPEEQRRLMEQDPRWWEPIRGVTTETFECIASKAEEVEPLAVDALKAVAALDNELLFKNAYIEFINGLLFGKSNALVQLILKEMDSDQKQFFGALLYRLSKIYLHNDKKRALDCARYATQFMENAQCYYHLGKLLRENGNLEDALDAFGKAAALDPFFPNVHLQLSKTHHQLGYNEQALQAARESVAINAANPLFFHHLGNLLQSGGDLEGALEALEKASVLDPSFPNVQIQMSRICTKLGDIERAIEKVRDAIGIQNDNPLYYHHLGYLLQTSGQPERAAQAREKAMALKRKKKL